MYTIKLTYKAFVPHHTGGFHVFKSEHFESGKLVLWKLLYYPKDTTLDAVLADVMGIYAPDELLFQDALL